MITVAPMTHDEKIALYMKMKKLELAEMLANANEALAARGPQMSYTFEVPLSEVNRTITCVGGDRSEWYTI